MDRQPAFVRQHAKRLHRRVVVVQRLSHAHQHDVEWGVGQLRVVREHANLPDDLPARQIPDEAHPARQAERARHRAPDLSRDAEGLRWRVRNVDRLDPPIIGQTQQVLGRAVRRRVDFFERRGGDRERCCQPGPKGFGQVRHLGEIGHAPRVNPRKDLPAVEGWKGQRLERLLDAATIEFGEVSRLGGHDAGRKCRDRSGKTGHYHGIISALGWRS